MKRLFAVSNGMNDEVRHNEQGTTSDKQVTPTSEDPSTSVMIIRTRHNSS